MLPVGWFLGEGGGPLLRYRRKGALHKVHTHSLNGHTHTFFLNKAVAVVILSQTFPQRFIRGEEGWRNTIILSLNPDTAGLLVELVDMQRH